MELDLNLLRPQERVSLQLRMLYEKAGFLKYHMGRFEEYGLYQENRRFLSSGQVITFTDLDGRLLALKPDVTLSIAKNAPIGDRGCGRFYYQENVYRPSQESHTFQEISQMGLECIGDVDEEVTAQAVSLAIQSLALTEREYVLEVSHMGFVTGLFDAVGAPESIRPKLLTCIQNRNWHELQECGAAAGLSKQGTAESLALNAAMGAALSELRTLCESLPGQTDHLKLELSLVNDMKYYNGLVLQGFLSGLPRAVLKGGRYDPLAAQFRPGTRAIGYALYLDDLDRLDRIDADGQAEPVMLNVALPKGRLGDRVYQLLESVGYGCTEHYSDTRKLVVAADRIILPGVGAFGDARAKLDATGLVPVLREAAEEKPLLGICLGMQLLFQESLEYGTHEGLGFIPGQVVDLRGDLADHSLKVPHMGWNRLEITREDPIFRYLQEGEFVYYVHSYYAKHCADSTLAVSHYGNVAVPGVVRRGNVWGMQFHPEKSGETGLRRWDPCELLLHCCHCAAGGLGNRSGRRHPDGGTHPAVSGSGGAAVHPGDHCGERLCLHRAHGQNLRRENRCGRRCTGWVRGHQRMEGTLPGAGRGLLPPPL